MQTQRHLPIKGTYNVRDLGGYATQTGQTQWGRLLRADALHRLDSDGVDALLANGVTTVIDLRHGDELVHQPNPFNGHDAVVYHNVSLFAAFAPSLMSEGDLLLELYKTALTQRQTALAEVLQLIADAPSGAVLFHCTAGKDRTGIDAALLLGVAGVEAELIVEDYALTAAMIAPIIAEITEGAVARGADPKGFQRLLAAEPATMVATLAFIRDEFGGMDAYLDRIGLTAATVERLRNRLMGEI
jgi:protein-tyrosine phosphatase